MSALQFTLRIFSVGIIAISLTHVIAGPTWMPDVDTVSPSADSQHRFYTALFMFFGIALLWACRNLRERVWMVRWVSIAFLAGGLARLVSIAMVGMPHLLFVTLLVIELTAPLIVLWWCAQVVKGSVGK